MKTNPTGLGARSDNVVWSAVTNLNLALAFFLELAVLASAGLWAFGISGHLVVGIVAVACAVTGFAGAWALFGAPRAVVRLAGVSKILFFLLWFGLGALTLAAAGHPSWAVGLFLLYLLNLSLISIGRRAGYGNPAHDAPTHRDANF